MEISSYRRFILSVLVSFLLLPSAGLSRQQQTPHPEYGIYDQDLLPPSFFKHNRERLMQMMGDSSALILYAAPERVRNNDVDYVYRQDDDFFYLTGCNEPDAALFLSTKGVETGDSTRKQTVHEILFVRPRRPSQETWIGRRMGPEGAMQALGLEYALSISDMSSWLWRMLRGHRQVYLPLPAGGMTGELAGPVSDLNADALRLEGTTEFRTPAHLIHDLRSVKSPEEIALIRKAVNASVDGHKRMMQTCRPGMFEYQLAAEFESATEEHGAEYLAYPCIAGSGENSVILHYESNRKELKKGEVVVLDCGAEYHNYASDITRTLPVDGKFTDAQRAIYSIVLHAQEEAIKQMKPGVSYWPAVQQAAERVIRDGLLKLGIIHDSLAYRKYFIHGIGHPVGLDVHDVSSGQVLREGQVWTVEPGIYIPSTADSVDVRYRNIGVRIEDDILITADGHEVLSRDLPREPDAVERFMRSGKNAR